MAYEILSDAEKRKNYDLELEQTTPNISYEEYINVVNQRDYLNTVLNNLRNKSYNFNNSNNINQNYNNKQTQYNRMNSNYSNNTYNCYKNHTTSSYSSTNNAYNYQKTNNIYNFSYYKQKLKDLFSNISLLLLSILVAIIILKLLSNFNLFII